MEVPAPFSLVPPAGALPTTHVTAGALETVQVKSVEGTVDWSMISVVPLLQKTGVLLVVAAADGMAFILKA
jgi:hypothetical protein